MFGTIVFFDAVNYLAVFVAAIAYFLLGALWYSVLFGKTWSKGIEEMGIKMTMPGKGQMGIMMAKSFVANLLSAFSIAFLIKAIGGGDAMFAIKMGIVCGCGLTLASQMMVANWQNTKASVLVIDAGYQILGITMSCLIISLWP